MFCAFQVSLRESSGHIRKPIARPALRPRRVSCTRPLSDDGEASRCVAPMLALVVCPVSWCLLSHRKSHRQSQNKSESYSLCSATNVSMSRKSKRIGPPFVRRTHGNSPQDTFRLIVIFETASSRAASAIPIRGVTAFLLAEVFLRLRLSGE